MCFLSSVDFKLLLLVQIPLVTHQAQRRNPRLFCLLLIYIICIKQLVCCDDFKCMQSRALSTNSPPFLPPLLPVWPPSSSLIIAHLLTVFPLSIPLDSKNEGGNGIVFPIHFISVYFQRNSPASIPPFPLPVPQLLVANLTGVIVNNLYPFVQVRSYFPVYYEEETMHQEFWRYPHPRPVSREQGMVRALRQVHVTHLPWD